MTQTTASIQWRMHFLSPPQKVYAALTSDTGRASFWAESAPEQNGQITFQFLNYPTTAAKILKRLPNRLFQLEYFGTTVTFQLQATTSKGTDLLLTATDIPADWHTDMHAGWVSVLMAMKAAVDHGIDLRNHDAQRSWKQGYADN